MQAAETQQPTTQNPNEKTDAEHKRGVRKLHSTRFESAEFVTQHWRAMIPTSDTVEDLLRPEYWVHIASRVKPLAIIEAVWEDASRFVRLIVSDTDKNPSPLWIMVSVIEDVDLNRLRGASPEPTEGMFEVRYINHHSKWGVYRKSDKAKMRDKLESEGAARNWLSDHIKAQKR